MPQVTALHVILTSSLLHLSPMSPLLNTAPISLQLTTEYQKSSPHQRHWICQPHLWRWEYLTWASWSCVYYGKLVRLYTNNTIRKRETFPVYTYHMSTVCVDGEGGGMEGGRSTTNQQPRSKRHTLGTVWGSEEVKEGSKGVWRSREEGGREEGRDERIERGKS